MIPGLVTDIGGGHGAVHDRIRALTGLAFSAARQEALRAGLEKGMMRAGARDPGAYLDRLAREPALLDDLVADITVGETYFFRDAPQCELLRDRVLPELLDTRGRGPLRIWSAGCATGEEAYTLAILHAGTGAPHPARILGTDLSRRSLARARRGRYATWSLRALPTGAVARYFEPAGADYILRPDFRDAVEFRYLNLAEDSYPSLTSGTTGMDLILCRNVLIYFDGETADRVTRRLVEALAPGGWLLLGASDPLPADAGPCEVVVTGAGLAYRRKAERPVLGAESQWRLPSPPPGPPPANGAEGAADAPPAGAEIAADAIVPADADLPASVARVRALADTGDLQAAGSACAAALERHRTSAELTYLHGVLLSEAGNPAGAAGAFRTSLYLDRTLAVAHFALGSALLRTGDEPGARRALRNAERLLVSSPPEAPVPASGGESASRLLSAARAHLAFLAGAVR